MGKEKGREEKEWKAKGKWRSAMALAGKEKDREGKREEAKDSRERMYSYDLRSL